MSTSTRYSDEPLSLIDAGHRVVSWQGVRRDESQNRRDAKSFERIGPRLYAHRPIAGWTAQQTVDFVRARGVSLNPLYSLGMGRVGCMPCINASKPEIKEIAQRFPEHPKKISEWERLVGQASKRGFSTFMADSHPAPDRREVFADLNIWSRIEWSKTSRGGKNKGQTEMFAEPAPAYASSYGLCE